MSQKSAKRAPIDQAPIDQSPIDRAIVTPPELARPSLELNIPNSRALSMIRLSAHTMMSEDDHVDQLLGRLLASSLSRLPDTPAERAQWFVHHDRAQLLCLSGDGWSLEMTLSADPHLESSPEEPSLEEPPHILKRLELTTRDIRGGEARYTDPRVHLVWAYDLDPYTDHALIKRWRDARDLALRARMSGVSRSTPNAQIASTARLHSTVEIQGEVIVGASTKIWHFSKLIGPLKIGERCSFGQNVVIERGVEIGDNVKVQNNVSIYAGVILEDDVFCGPSMVFTNVGTPRSHYPRRDAYSVTRVKRGASIGANATIVCGNTLGRYCFVGAGAVVTKDVPDYALVYGNPARIRGWACYCGVGLSFSASDHDDQLAESECGECGRRYHKRGDRVEPLE